MIKQLITNIITGLVLLIPIFNTPVAKAPVLKWYEQNELYASYLPENSLHPSTERGFKRYDGPSGTEDYYNCYMNTVIRTVRSEYPEDEYPYWIRQDGCKMLGEYLICSADYERYERGDIIDTSLGKAIIVEFNSINNYNAADIWIATSWK